MQVGPKQAVSVLTSILKAGKVPMLKGSPAIGKSDVIHAIAKMMNLLVIDMRLSTADPADLNGYPQLKEILLWNEDGTPWLDEHGIQKTVTKGGYAPMDTFPLRGERLPHGYSGWLLFFDEFTSAKEELQAAAYKILLDRKVGMYDLHSKVHILCAGNLESDNAIVVPMGTAMRSRLIHVELVVELKDWLIWANENGVDHRITSYVNWRTDKLYDFKATSKEDSFPAPRTWSFANDLLATTTESRADRIVCIAGAIGEGTATEFMEFTEIYRELPKIDDLVADPDKIGISDRPDILFAMTGLIAHHADNSNIAQLDKYIRRMPPEFHIVCLRQMIQRNPAMIGNATVQKWVNDHADELID